MPALKVWGTGADEPFMDAASSHALAAMISGDALGDGPLFVGVLVLALTVLTALWTAARPGVLRASLFVACALMWLRANHHLEGAVLLSVTPEHGLTVADLLPPSLAALILAHAVRPASRPAVSRAER